MNRNTKSLLILALLVPQLFYAQPSNSNVFNGIDFVASKFKTHNIVAIGETHDKVEVTDFYIDLLDNKSFQKSVDVIVIEMGNHLFQDVLDDYINGENVDQQELYKLWRDHTSCMLNNSDNTGLIRFLKKVREINQNSDKKIRVVAGDPDIDWAKTNCLQEFYKYLGKRDDFYANVVMAHVVKPKKKALIIMGNSHFNKMKTESMVKKGTNNPVTFLLPKSNNNIFLLNIMSASSFPYEKLKGLKKGSVITTNDNWLGNLRLSTPFIKVHPLKDQTDAIIYLGEKKNLKAEVTTPFNNKLYEKELKKRTELPECND